MAKIVIEIPDEKLSELEAYKDKLGEILLLGLSQMKIQDALLLYRQQKFWKIRDKCYPNLFVK